jgi:tetratricopeptide (TPR) repeat protein
MTDAAMLDSEPFYTTDGEIAVVNLGSACARSWQRFFQDPLQPGAAEIVIEQEQLTAQFVGDLSALDRIDLLANQLVQLDAGSARTALIRAQVASMMHRFSDARHYLAQAQLGGAPPADLKRLRLSIDQACGSNLDMALDERRKLAEDTGRLEDLVPLGALLADLGEFTGAEEVYRNALRAYRDVSPFPVAWVCFQLGVLWGEFVPEPQWGRAEHWYRKAVSSLPRYVKARVHLAEIYSSTGRTSEAEATLNPAIASGDPEVPWRLADVFTAAGRFVEAEAQLEVARSGFEGLLEKHLLAFADHGAEFYLGSGNDASRAFELARINVANRPTLRAFKQAQATALAAGEFHVAAKLTSEAASCWGDTVAFRSSPLAMPNAKDGGRYNRV